MVKPATTRLKVNPPLGRMPTLQFCRPAELRIDAAYQRDVGNGASQALIRKIAQHWNWDLCQPLVVARRTDLTERLYVIDGQHRLEAARLRGDIEQLPCVIVAYASQADEAASFVHLNQQRRPLTRIDLFKAAVASEDAEAVAIMTAIEEAGLTLAPHLTSAGWKPGMIGNVGGLEACWRRHGAAATREALRVMAKAWPGQVLTYAGALFPGICAVCAIETVPNPDDEFDGWRDMLTEMVGETSQIEWRGDVLRHKADNPGLQFAGASEAVFITAWSELLDAFLAEDEDVPAQAAPKPAPPPAPLPPPAPVQAKAPAPAKVILAPPKAPAATAASKAGGGAADEPRWCDQCESRVHLRQASLCKSRFCKLRPSLTGART